jgi:pimeloyl-ACP methyl ester carboxylesterase
VHVPDPLRGSPLVDRIAASLAPRWRVLSVSPRDECALQVHVADLVGVMSQFGLYGAAIVAEGLGCAAALVLAAWHPERVAALALIDRRFEIAGDSFAARSLRDCPPDWTRLRRDLGCSVVELTADQPDLGIQVERWLSGRVP